MQNMVRSSSETFEAHLATFSTFCWWGTCYLGSVIRIGPNEIHLNDADNYDKIYRVGTKYSKDPELYNAFGVPYAGFGTPSNELQ